MSNAPEISRRSFLGGVLALTAAASVPVIRTTSNLPIIVGDGINDDADGLNALFRGDPVKIRAEGVRRTGGHIMINKGFFLLSRKLEIVNDITLENSGFFHTPEFDGREMLQFSPTSNAVIKRCYVGPVSH